MERLATGNPESFHSWAREFHDRVKGFVSTATGFDFPGLGCQIKPGWRTPRHGNPGRVAGLWYLLIGRIGPLRLICIRATLFRVGIVSDLIGRVVLVLLLLAFYRLFPGVDQNLALQVVIFGGIPRFPGFWLMLGGLSYVALSFTGVMFQLIRASYSRRRNLRCFESWLEGCGF